mmetsp:Transcript_53693/g.173379  ORF Transcript_53693/g.173379 Transcript_53693/m.173379 type:complete len:438 (-) Transcript_53693:2250-3563(-)
MAKLKGIAWRSTTFARSVVPLPPRQRVDKWRQLLYIDAGLQQAATYAPVAVAVTFGVVAFHVLHLVGDHDVNNLTWFPSMRQDWVLQVIMLPAIYGIMALRSMIRSLEVMVGSGWEPNLRNVAKDESRKGGATWTGFVNYNQETAQDGNGIAYRSGDFKLEIGGTSLDLTYADAFLKVLLVLSSIQCLYNVMMVCWMFQLADMNPSLKFMGTRALVMFAQWQPALLDFASRHVRSFHYSPAQVQLLHASLMCYECLLVSLLHLVSWPPEGAEARAGRSLTCSVVARRDEHEAEPIVRSEMNLKARKNRDGAGAGAGGGSGAGPETAAPGRVGGSGAAAEGAPRRRQVALRGLPRGRRGAGAAWLTTHCCSLHLRIVPHRQELLAQLTSGASSERQASVSGWRHHPGMYRRPVAMGLPWRARRRTKPTACLHGLRRLW